MEDMLAILKNKYEESIEEINLCENVDQLSDIIDRELNEYMCIIESFFVDEENNIRYIYESIRKNDFPYNKVNLVDVNLSNHIYSDYMEGMNEFVQRIASLRDDYDIKNESVEDTINKVYEKDKEFTSSLFTEAGGNPPTYVNLNEAMKNIEVLIELNDRFNNYKNMVDNAVGFAKENASDKYKSEVLNGLKVFTESISSYTYESINNIFHSYSAIKENMSKRTPAGSKYSTNSSTYVLF